MYKYLDVNKKFIGYSQILDICLYETHTITCTNNNKLNQEEKKKVEKKMWLKRVEKKHIKIK